MPNQQLDRQKKIATAMKGMILADIYNRRLPSTKPSREDVYSLSGLTRPGDDLGGFGQLILDTQVGTITGLALATVEVGRRLSLKIRP